MKQKIINNSRKERVLIIVLGGVVQSVYSDNENLRVDLLDFDNEEFPSKKMATCEFEKRRDNMVEVF